MRLRLRQMALIILIKAACVSLAEFVLGRIRPTGFDLTELDGRLTPGEAADKCEAHARCAGFTYRGLMDNSDQPDRK